MTQQTQTPITPNDEISLVDLWLIVAKRKWLFWGVFFGALLLGFVYTLIRPEQHDYKAVIEIGGYRGGNGVTLGQFELLEQPLALMAKIEQSYWPQARLDAMQPDDTNNIPSDITLQAPEDGRIVSLMITAPMENKQTIVSLLDSVLNAVHKDHAVLLQDRVALLTQLTQQRLTDIEERINALQQSRSDAVANSSAETKALTMLMIDTKLQELQAEQADLLRQLKVTLTTDIRQTKAIFGPVQMPKPAGPGALVIMVLAAFIGAMLGAGAVFVAEFLHLARIRQQQ